MNRSGDLKICDFGSGRGDTDGTVKVDSRKVASLPGVIEDIIFLFLLWVS